MQKHDIEVFTFTLLMFGPYYVEILTFYYKQMLLPSSPSSSSGYYTAPTLCRMGGRHTTTWTNSTAASISTTW